MKRVTLQNRFQVGQTVLLRDIWQDKILTAKPEIVVQDTPELMVFYLPEGTIFKQPVAIDGTHVRGQDRFLSEWVLQDVEYNGRGLLRMAIPGACYSVLLFRNVEDNGLRAWYINLEDAMYRSSLGYDSFDQFLDIIVSPDLSEWYWEDEDELEEAINIGLISKEKVSVIYDEGKKTIDWLQSGKSPFNGWENWQHDPSWRVPVIPKGWNII